MFNPNEEWLAFHECPDCGQACYCDLDDSNCALDDISDCEHDCEEEEEDDGE